MRKIHSLLFFLVVYSHSSLSSYPWLDSMDPENDYIKSGQRLMSLEYGLSPLEVMNKREKIAVIGVHGGRSEGYEWVYPLTKLDRNDRLTLFYRWDDGSCFLSSALKLNQEILFLLEENSAIEKIVLLGHSYGGILLTWFIENWSGNIPIEIHTIASPLGGIKTISKICDYSPPEKIKTNVRSIQWKTIKSLDNVFKNLSIDPQLINLKGHEVHNLPNEYNGKRLGHNWSISYVADEIYSSYMFITN